jgi:hypothetical protein
MQAPAHCYIDESIHESLGFVALAFVFTEDEPTAVVSKALTEAGIGEFKSGARMATNPRMQQAREELFTAINNHARIAVVFAPHHVFVRSPLGKQLLQALQSVLIRNGIRPQGLTLHIDEGIFTSALEAKRLIGIFRFLGPAEFRSAEASHECLGIQLADLVSHTFAQIVREALTGTRKEVDVGGADTGYADGTRMELGVALLMSIRHAILARRMVAEGDDFDPATDPVILGPDDDQSSTVSSPRRLGGGCRWLQNHPKGSVVPSARC